MTLKDVLNQMIQENQAAGQPTDLRIGTVTSAAPLEITVNVAAAPLQAGQLYLTEAVVEKKLPVLTHAHAVEGLGHAHAVSGLGHGHTTSGLGHSHPVSGLSHTHATADGDTGAGLSGGYQSGGGLEGSYPSDQQLTGSYSTSSALGSVTSGGALSGVACVEHGKTLPVENGYIILNRALEVGDRVLLLRVLSGQRFLVLSRIFEED